MRAHFRGVSGRYWRANRSWHSVQLVSLRIAGVEQFYQVQRMIGGIGNMLFSISPKLQHGQGPSLRWTHGARDNSHLALNCLIDCLPSKNLFDNSAPQLSFFKNNGLIKATIQPAPWGTPCQSKRCSERLFEKEQTRMYQCRTDGKRFTKKRRPKWPMDGLMPWNDILNTLRRLTSLTLQQQNSEADIKIFFIYEHLAKIWMGHPQHQDLGTRNRIMSWKVCRSSGEKMLESDSSQQVPGSDRMINFILTQKRVPSVA